MTAHRSDKVDLAPWISEYDAEKVFCGQEETLVAAKALSKSIQVWV